MKTDFDLPRGVKIFRFFALPLFRFLFRSLCRVEVEGYENLPEEGGYLVAPNHVSIYDPPFVVVFWPRTLEAAGAADVLRRPIQGWLMHLYGGIPVHRGEVDRKMLEGVLTRLRAGMPVMIMPEGRRSHVPGLQPAHMGTAYLAAKSGAAVVPVGVTGTGSVIESWKRLERPELRMAIGDPIHLPPIDLRSPDRKKALKRHTEMIMRALAALLPVEYRGIYAEGSSSVV